MYSKVIMTILKFSQKVIINEIIKDSSKLLKSFDFENELFDVIFF